MSYAFNDTIAAIATAPGGAARGIVRLSGSAVLECLKRCFRPDGACHLEEVRFPQVISGAFDLHEAGADLPAQLYFWPTERSYTRAPTAELHTFGSPPLLEELLRELCAAGARLARPGEFTLRAFLAGRIDLTQAEAVLGVIDAHERDDLDVALRQLAGGLAGPLDRLRGDLLDLLAELEAGLDFVEEEIEFISREALQTRLNAAARVVSSLVEQMTSRGQAAGEPTVALLGWPNVGKSSLMNALCGDATAIVSQQAGTTRDYLTARLELGGITCRIIDTAGVEQADEVDEADEVSAAAQQMRRQQQRQCDLQLLCIDTTRPLTAWEQEQLDQPPEASRLIVLTKTDAPRTEEDLPHGLATSAVTHWGIDLLRRAIAEALSAREADSQVVAGTAARCRESLAGASESLARAERLASEGGGEELIAAELRTALGELGKVVGAVYTDDILDRIFSRFCIGK